MLPLRRILTTAVAGAALAGAALTGSASAYVGGHDALADKPFTTGLRLAGGSEFFCTGTLLQPSWVLTAAHCLDGGRTAASLELVIGDRNIDDAADPAETRYADSIVLHPGWGGDTSDENDVALVHLTTPSTIAPVRLGTTPAFVDGIKRCIQQLNSFPFNQRAMVPLTCQSGRGKALGWGRRSMSASGTSHVLREVTPKIFGWSSRTFWRAKAGACPGDSGGPRCSCSPPTARPARSASPATTSTAAATSTGSSATSARPRATTSTPTSPPARCGRGSSRPPGCATIAAERGRVSR